MGMSLDNMDILSTLMQEAETPIFVDDITQISDMKNLTKSENKCRTAGRETDIELEEEQNWDRQIEEEE